jgi:hypothetical protein
MHLDSVGTWLILGVVFLLLLGIRRRREGIRHRLRRVFVVEVTYGLVAAFMLANGRTSKLAAVAIAIIVALLVARSLPNRSRYIPRQVRKEVIQRYESESRRKFNRRIHELDHVVPFSKGGSSTADNLRVTHRSDNRRKAARSPWWDLLGR